jgi:hypothetical protein
MEGFSPKSPQDWEVDDATGGCVRDTRLDCRTSYKNTSSTDIFHSMARVKLPSYPLIIEDAMTQSECEEACHNDCSCNAYSYNSSSCSIWHGEMFSLSQTDGIDFFF